MQRITYNEVMSKKHIFLIAALFFFVQFIIFSYLVHENLFTTVDFNTTVKLQDRIPLSFDNEFSFFSDVGKFQITTLVLLAIFVITRRFFAGFIAFGTYVVFHLIELFGKYYVNHPPPPEFMLRTERILMMPEFHVRSEYSYPSGHSGRTVFISIILMVLLWQSKRIPMPVKLVLSGLIVGFDISMLVSRVSLGEHWTTDVIGGTLLGAACGFFASMFLTKEKEHAQEGKKKGLFPKYKVEIKRVE